MGDEPVKTALLALPIVTLIAADGLAQTSGPQPMPIPMPAEIAAPKDVAYKGTIKLAVDATDIDRHIFRVRETIPAEAGPWCSEPVPSWWRAARGRDEAPCAALMR